MRSSLYLYNNVGRLTHRDVDTVVVAELVFLVRKFTVENINPCQLRIPAAHHGLDRKAGVPGQGIIFRLGPLSQPLPLLWAEQTVLSDLPGWGGHPVEAGQVGDAGDAGEAVGGGVLLLLPGLPGVETGLSQTEGWGGPGHSGQVKCPLVRPRDDQLGDTAGQPCG